MQEDFFIKILTSPFIARVRKGCVGFYCERELEIGHNGNILTPRHVVAVTLCLSYSLMLNRRSRGHSAGWWLSLWHLISIFSGPQLIRAQRPLWTDVAFPTTSCLQLNCLQLNWQLTGSSNSIELYNCSTPTRSLKSNV